VIASVRIMDQLTSTVSIRPIRNTRINLVYPHLNFTQLQPSVHMCCRVVSTILLTHHTIPKPSLHLALPQNSHTTLHPSSTQNPATRLHPRRSLHEPLRTETHCNGRCGAWDVFNPDVSPGRGSLTAIAAWSGDMGPIRHDTTRRDARLWVTYNFIETSSARARD
jgi:hypothetical protein